MSTAARQALARARASAAAKGLRRTAPGSGRRRNRLGPGLGNPGSGSAPSRRDPQLLGPIVDKLVTERGWSAPVSMGGVVGRWREIVGDQLADHCEVETFDDAQLVLRADSTAWATQLRLLQPQLERRRRRADHYPGPGRPELDPGQAHGTRAWTARHLRLTDPAAHGATDCGRTCGYAVIPRKTQ